MPDFTLGTLAFFLFGVILFAAIAKSFPRGKSLEQTQQLKIAVLFAIGTFGFSFLATIGIWFAQMVSGASHGGSFLFGELMSSLIRVILEASCLGIYLAILVLALIYWRFSRAAWLSLDLQAGASAYDALVERLRRLVARFR